VSSLTDLSNNTWRQNLKEKPSHENTCMRKNNDLLLFHPEIQNYISILQTLVRVWTKVKFIILQWEPYKTNLIVK
jgi:hypothetical protein